MRTNSFDIAIDNFAEENKLPSVTLTYGTNGYPSFGDHTRIAFWGFDNKTLEDIREIASKYPHASVHQIYWKDGWDGLAVDKGEAYELIPVDPGDFGNELSVFIPEDSMPTEILNDIISDCEGDSLELEKELTKFLKTLKETNDAYLAADDDELVLVNGITYDRTVKNKDSKVRVEGNCETFAIAIVFDSDDFSEEETEN